MMRRCLKRQLKILILLVTIVGLLFTLAVNVIDTKVKLVDSKCRDWHDYDYIEYEKQRSGPGEQGHGVKLTEPSDIELNAKLYNETGFSVVVSDKISVNRSIVDTRPEECATLKYFAKLPKVSIIIIFVNEVRSVLLRTVHSIVNRTPPELIHEIILVNDNSTDPELYEPLEKYMRTHFRGVVKIKNLTGRRGLIVTRMEGARIATGEILVFFDSHIEVGTNWLPPLLEPLVGNRRLATVPIIDDFDCESFKVFPNNMYGDRGGVDWMLIFRHFERYLPNGVDPSKPFPIPIQLGCAFAIDRKFFLEELGGYDEGFQVWNGENYELSFKLWLCADGLYEVPCSRVTHTFRSKNPSRVRKDDFVGRNFKRLAEVWMDEYKDIVYSFEEHRYKKIDPGDLTVAKQVHDRLNCKPFKYFMEEVAPDFIARYPPTKDQPVFASGQIKSVGVPGACLDNFYRGEFESIGIFNCEQLDDLGMPPQSQFFRLNFNKNIVLGFFEFCLDSYKMSMPQCSNLPYGNQYWIYDHEKFLLRFGSDEGENCMSGNFNNQTLSSAPCDESDPNQLWTFTFVNKTALNDWKNINDYRKFMYGDKGINRSKMLPLVYESCDN